MITPEKNDVDISRLFNWGKEITIEEMTFYIRVTGDADLNRARVYALRKSAELRRKLKDVNSDERLAYIADEEMVERENLIEILLISASRSALIESTKKVVTPFPKEPSSEATLEEQEKYQDLVDTWTERREQAVRAFVMEKIDKQREVLNSKSKEELYAEYVKERINDLCEGEMRNCFLEMCAFSNTFKDATCKERVFETIDEFQNLPPKVKEEFELEYNSLELSMDELKK